MRGTLTAAALALALALLSGCASRAYQPSYLTGTVTVPAGTQLKRGATMLKVRLVDQSGAGAELVLAEQYQDAPKAFPHPYALSYDAQAIQPGHDYALQASVYENGELRLASPEVRVLAADSPANPAITALPIAK